MPNFICSIAILLSQGKILSYKDKKMLRNYGMINSCLALYGRYIGIVHNCTLVQILKFPFAYTCVSLFPTVLKSGLFLSCVEFRIFFEVQLCKKH